ncbi:hypothetical protein N3K66_002321 [Trichothecium roseum]|uniref:Uncharacterized protein n=1 Tax=Trichothecium roseum TaxID=47278 RepID=A0ACC0V9V5_9HYPO|nr:hypothetical protein N3K66_002321 [Trichothecium roseum]
MATPASTTEAHKAGGRYGASTSSRKGASMQKSTRRPRTLVIPRRPARRVWRRVERSAAFAEPQAVSDQTSPALTQKCKEDDATISMGIATAVPIACPRQPSQVDDNVSESASILGSTFTPSETSVDLDNFPLPLSYSKSVFAGIEKVKTGTPSSACPAPLPHQHHRATPEEHTCDVRRYQPFEPKGQIPICMQTKQEPNKNPVSKQSRLSAANNELVEAISTSVASRLRSPSISGRPAVSRES